MPPIAHGNFAGKRLVIFGCGYVGGEMARQAVDHGMRVTALTRNAAAAATLRTMGVASVVVADLASDAWHGEIAGGAEFVLNAVSSGGGGVDGYRLSYLNGMRSILRWAAERGGLGTLVYTSSTSVYPQDGGVSVDETASTDGEGERPKILVEAETLLREAPAQIVRRHFILRLAGIYGPGRQHLLEQVRTGAVAGHGKHRLNLVHRDDICAAIWLAFAGGPARASDVFNVADDGAAPKEEVARWLAEKLGVPLPGFTGLPAGGRRAVTPDRTIVNAKLKRELGWSPRYPTFREGYENILSRGME